MKKNITEELETLKILIADEVTMKVFSDYSTRTIADEHRVWHSMDDALSDHFSITTELLKGKSLPELHKDRSFLELKGGMIAELTRRVIPSSGRVLYSQEERAFNEVYSRMEHDLKAYPELLTNLGDAKDRDVIKFKDSDLQQIDRKAYTIKYTTDGKNIHVIDPAVMSPSDYKAAVEKFSEIYSSKLENAKSNFKQQTMDRFQQQLRDDTLTSKEFDKFEKVKYPTANDSTLEITFKDNLGYIKLDPSKDFIHAQFNKKGCYLSLKQPYDMFKKNAAVMQGSYASAKEQLQQRSPQAKASGEKRRKRVSSKQNSFALEM